MASTPLTRIGSAPAQGVLSVRERQIALLVAQGCINKEIAASLGISPATVASTMQRMFLKLGVRRRAALVHSVLRGDHHGAVEQVVPPARSDGRQRDRPG